MIRPTLTACLGLFLAAAPLLSQTNATTPIVATRLRMGGVPIASGTLSITPVDKPVGGAAIAVTTADGGSDGVAAFAAPITAGAISGFSVPDQCTASTLVTGQRIYYLVTITANLSSTSHPSTTYVIPPNTVCGATPFAIDHYAAPQVATAQQTGLIVADPMPAKCTSPSFYYSPSGAHADAKCVGGVFVPYGGSGGAATTNASQLTAGTLSPSLLPTIPVAKLATTTITVNGQPCALGGNCTIPTGSGGSATTDASQLTSGTLNAALLPTIPATKLPFVPGDMATRNAVDFLPAVPTDTTHNGFWASLRGAGGDAAPAAGSIPTHATAFGSWGDNPAFFFPDSSHKMACLADGTNCPAGGGGVSGLTQTTATNSFDRALAAPGFQSTGSAAGYQSFLTGTGSPANAAPTTPYVGLGAPTSLGTSGLFDLPAPGSAGIPMVTSATPAYNLNGWDHYPMAIVPVGGTGDTPGLIYGRNLSGTGQVLCNSQDGNGNVVPCASQPARVDVQNTFIPKQIFTGGLTLPDGAPVDGDVYMQVPGVATGGGGPVNSRRVIWESSYIGLDGGTHTCRWTAQVEQTNQFGSYSTMHVSTPGCADSTVGGTVFRVDAQLIAPEVHTTLLTSDTNGNVDTSFALSIAAGATTSTTYRTVNTYGNQPNFVIGQPTGTSLGDVSACTLVVTGGAGDGYHWTVQEQCTTAPANAASFAGFTVGRG